MAADWEVQSRHVFPGASVPSGLMNCAARAQPARIGEIRCRKVERSTTPRLGRVAFITSIKVGSRSWYTVPLSIIVHTGILVAVVIIPLMAADVLPTPPAMMNAFVAAKEPYLEQLKRGQGDSPEDKRYRNFLSLMSDPLPYGIAANRPSIEALVTYSLQQKLIPSRPQLNQVFVEIDP